MQPAQRRRIFLSNQSRDDRNIKQAFTELTRIAAADSSISEACLLVDTQRQVRQTALGGFLGDHACKRLLAGESINLLPTLSLRLATKLSNRPVHDSTAIIVGYASDELLRVAEESSRAKVIIVASWVDERCEQWCRAWNPDVPGKANQPAEELVTNAVVRVALESLTGRINLGSGLLHPSDKHAAKEMLVILHAAGEWEVPKNMEAWALRRGWTPDGAHGLRTLAERVQGGTRFSVGRPSVWAAEILSLWRARASGEQRSTSS